MNRRMTLLMLGSLALCISAVGCGGSSRERYVPAKTTARDAVQAALDTWKSGAKHGPLAAPKAVIHVFDARWRDGKKLESFQIVEELPGTDQPEFKVTMKLAGEPEETCTYIVIGIDPLQVFRDVDYKQAQSM